MPCIYVLNLKSKCRLKQDFKTIKSWHKNLHPLSYFGNFSLDFLWFTLSFFPFREKRKKKIPQLCNFGLLELQGFANMLCLRNFFKVSLCFVFWFFFNLHPKNPKVTEWFRESFFILSNVKPLRAYTNILVNTLIYDRGLVGQMRTRVEKMSHLRIIPKALMVLLFQDWPQFKPSRVFLLNPP